MSNIKRIIVVVVIIVAVLLISSSFVGSNIMDRAIIIGLGVEAYCGSRKPGQQRRKSRDVQQDGIGKRAKRRSGYSAYSRANG